MLVLVHRWIFVRGSVRETPLISVYVRLFRSQSVLLTKSRFFSSRTLSLYYQSLRSTGYRNFWRKLYLYFKLSLRIKIKNLNLKLHKIYTVIMKLELGYATSCAIKFDHFLSGYHTATLCQTKCYLWYHYLIYNSVPSL